jgi:hypothetical protein
VSSKLSSLAKESGAWGSSSLDDTSLTLQNTGRTVEKANKDPLAYLDPISAIMRLGKGLIDLKSEG